jgi:hypothetical protein
MELTKNQYREFPLQDYKKRYMVSKEGKISSNKTKQFLNTIKSNGHNIFYVNKPNSNNREQFRVDKIIALAFLGESDKYLNHIDII